MAPTPRDERHAAARRMADRQSGVIAVVEDFFTRSHAWEAVERLRINA